MSQSFHTPYAPHTGSSSAVCLAVSLHIAAALPNLMSFELMRSDWSKKEYNPLRHDLVTTQFEFFEDGFLLVPSPEKPGIGIELNEEILERYTVS